MSSCCLVGVLGPISGILSTCRQTARPSALGKQDSRVVFRPLFSSQVLASRKPARVFAAKECLQDETLPLDRSHNVTLPDEPVRAGHMEALDLAQVLPLSGTNAQPIMAPKSKCS